MQNLNWFRYNNLPKSKVILYGVDNFENFEGLMFFFCDPYVYNQHTSSNFIVYYITV